MAAYKVDKPHKNEVCIGQGIVKMSKQSCKATIEQGAKKGNQCNKQGRESGFCGKHEPRALLLKDAKERGVRICDDGKRACKNDTIDLALKCSECLEKERLLDNTRYAERKKILVAAQASHTSTRSCITCARDFEQYNTKYGKDSANCKECSEKQGVQDAKRKDRVRNFKEERRNNLEDSYKRQISESLKWGYGDFEPSFDEYKTLVTSPCHYCKHYIEAEAIGIDRVNNDIGYTRENCVPACWKCNRMKHFYHPIFFLEKCKILMKETIPTKDFYAKWSLYYTRSCYHNYTTYKREAEERSLPFELTQQQWDWLTRSQCYLCGYQDARGIGIDRLDNTVRKYSLENCRPCCGSCNSMKGELPLQDLLDQCISISQAHPTGEAFQHIPITKNPLRSEVIEDRVHWKAKGLYYAILSDAASSFFNLYKDTLTEEEFATLCSETKVSEKATAIASLSSLLERLRKRRFRKNTKV